MTAPVRVQKAKKRYPCDRCNDGEGHGYIEVGEPYVRLSIPPSKVPEAGGFYTYRYHPECFGGRP